MSSIRFLHRSSLSLLPLQCCNCNNFFVHILLLISSLFSTLCGTNSVSKNNNNKQSCPCHHLQQQHKKINICNNIPCINSCSCALRLKKSIPNHPTQFASASDLSTRSGIQAAKSIDSHTSDTYILTQLTATAHIDTRDSCSSSSISWKRSNRNCILPTTCGRCLQQRLQQQNQLVYRASDFCWFENSKDSNYRRGSKSSSSGNNQNIISDCDSPQKTLLFQSNTKTYTRQHSIITSTIVEKTEVAAAVIAPTFVDLTHPSLHPSFTPRNNCEDSSFTSKNLINNNKPFSTSSAQRLFSSSSTPLLLQEKRQRTHSNTYSDVSTLLHVLVQLRKSTPQPRKPQHLFVHVKSYA